MADVSGVSTFSIFKYNIYFGYSIYEYGLVRADTLEQAKEKLKDIYSPTRDITVEEIKWEEDDTCYIVEIG